MEDTLGADDDPLSMMKSRRDAFAATRDPGDPILVSLEAAIAALERGEDLPAGLAPD
jgi:hypothetical protein